MLCILEKEKTLDAATMRKKSGQWDYIAVPNLDAALEVLNKTYEAGVSNQIDNFVLRSHGSTCMGMFIDNKHLSNPATEESLVFIRSILSNDANICFTACDMLNSYGSHDAKNTSRIFSQATAERFTDFFLTGTKRSFYANTKESTSRLVIKGLWYCVFDVPLAQSGDTFIHFKYNPGAGKSSALGYTNVNLQSKGVPMKAGAVGRLSRITSVLR